MAAPAIFSLLQLLMFPSISSVSLGSLGGCKIRLEAEFNTGMFHVEYSLGTPPVKVKGVLDSGSGIPWILCDPRGNLVYVPKRSSTAVELPCDSTRCNLGKYTTKCTDSCTYGYVYNDGNYAYGTMVTDTVELGGVSFQDFLIGCATNTTLLGEPGIVAFSPSHLSLVGQARLEKFSHCFTPPATSKKSPIFLGAAVDLSHGALGTIKSVPFVDKAGDPNRFHVSLKAISVGNTRVEMAGQAPGGGEFMLVDTGTDIVTFTMSIFDKLKEAFVKEAKLSAKPNIHIGIGEGLCFALGSGRDIKSLPSVTYHLDGVDMDGEDMYHPDGPELTCVHIRGLGNPGRFPAIWGNQQMRNRHMMYDMEHRRLSFVPAHCCSL